MAAADVGAARVALARARRDGLRRVRVAESALMLVLHAGYPAALEGARVLNEVWPGRSRRSREGTPADWMRRGAALARKVYGSSYPNLVRNVELLHPDLARWMIEQGYGRVLSRPGLDGRTRELVAVAVLAAGGWERQLVSHLLGARRLGTPLSEVRSAFRIGRARGTPRRRAACDRAWRIAFGKRAAGVR